MDLCGESGLVNQINDAQKLVNQYIYLGKNAIGLIQGVISQVKTISNALKNDPAAVLRTLQEDVLGIVSAEAMKDPNSALAKLLEIKNAYESAGPAVDRIVGNIQAFIKDPLNTPLDVCNDIPNLKRVGDAVIEVVNPAKVPPPDESPKEIRDEVAVIHEDIATIQATVSEEDLKNQKEQTIPTSGGAYPVPDVGEDRKLAGRTPPERVYNPKPGDAHAAAIYSATGQLPASTTNPVTGETTTATTTIDTGPAARTTVIVANTPTPTTRTIITPTTTTSPTTTTTTTTTTRPTATTTTTTPTTTTTTTPATATAPAKTTITPTPKASIANPYPTGKQYVAADFAPSKYAATIAQRVNTLDAAVRGSFAAGIQDYLKNNFKDGRDVSVGEAYRSPERSAQLAAAFAAGTGGRAAGAGKSWHNYGAACDLCIFVNGVWDKGTKGAAEYTGRARQSMAKFGLINDLQGDSGHFYIQSFGAGVPKALQEGKTTLAALAQSKGTALA